MSGLRRPQIKDRATFGLPPLDRRAERRLQECLDLWARTHAFGPNPWLARHFKNVQDAQEAAVVALRADVTRSLNAYNASDACVAALVTGLEARPVRVVSDAYKGGSTKLRLDPTVQRRVLTQGSRRFSFIYTPDFEGFSAAVDQYIDAHRHEDGARGLADMCVNNAGLFFWENTWQGWQGSWGQGR